MPDELHQFVFGFFLFLGVAHVVVHVGPFPVHFVEFLPEIMQDELAP